MSIAGRVSAARTVAASLAVAITAGMDPSPAGRVVIATQPTTLTAATVAAAAQAIAAGAGRRRGGDRRLSRGGLALALRLGACGEVGSCLGLSALAQLTLAEQALPLEDRVGERVAHQAAGADGVFMEVHDHPERALSDGANALPLRRFQPLVKRLRDLGSFVRKL